MAAGAPPAKRRRAAAGEAEGLLWHYEAVARCRHWWDGEWTGGLAPPQPVPPPPWRGPDAFHGCLLVWVWGRFGSEWAAVGVSH